MIKKLPKTKHSDEFFDILVFIREELRKYVIDMCDAPEPGSPEETFLLLKGYEPSLVSNDRWVLYSSKPPCII